jgi:hypothetical protein
VDVLSRTLPLGAWCDAWDVIADEGLYLPGSTLEAERREVVAAIELVSRGAATRVLVVGLVHAAELIRRLTPRATSAGVVIGRSMEDGVVTGVLVRPRPSVVA